MVKKDESPEALYENRHKTAYQPSSSFQIGVRSFELICNILTVSLMAVKASGEVQLYQKIPDWIIVGLAVSAVGTVVSTIFMFERQLKFPLVEIVTSLLLAVGNVVFVTVGAINTPHEIKCEDVYCSSPKAALFFSFVAIMSYAFSAFSAFKYWNDKRTMPAIATTAQNDEKL